MCGETIVASVRSWGEISFKGYESMKRIGFMKHVCKDSDRAWHRMSGRGELWIRPLRVGFECEFCEVYDVSR